MEEGSFRARALEDIGEEGVEYAPSEEGDISYQLGEKVRAQAQRLASLEQYKLLCESRILELVPDHPLPVLPDHLGMVPSDQMRMDLHQSHQKIARLEQQLAQSRAPLPISDFHSFPSPTSPLSFSQLQDLYSALYHKSQSLMSEQLDLEESLRSEVLRNEEQRAYIEALKQALETKMEELGFRSGSVDAFADLTHVQSKLVQLQREHSRCSLSLSDHSSTVRSLQDQLSTKSKEASEAQSRSLAISKELDEVTVALQQSVEELSKLEEEKSALLDYVQERAEVESALTEAKSQLESQLKSEKDTHSRVRGQLDTAETRLRGLQSSHYETVANRDHLSQQHSTLESELEATILRLNSAENRVKTIETQLANASELARTLAGKLDKTQTNNATLVNTLKETQAELDQLRTSYTSQLQELKSDKESLLSANSKLREVQELNRSLTTELKLYEDRLSGFDTLVEKLNKDSQDRLQSLHEKQDGTMRENLTLKQRLREIENELSSQKEDWLLQTNTFAGETKGLKNTLESLQVQLTSVNKEKEQLERKVIEYREKVEETNFKSMQMEVKRLAQNAASAQRRGDMLTEENTMLRNQLAQAESEGRGLSAQLHDREKKLGEALTANEALRASLESLQADLEKISSDTQTMAEEALRARQQERMASQTLTHHSDELSLLRKCLSQCAGLVSRFASNFGAVAAATATYTAVISPGFRDLILKWSEWVEGDVRGFAENIVEWVRVSTDESEALVRRVVELKAELATGGMTQSEMEKRRREWERCEKESRLKVESLERELDKVMEDNQALKRENDSLFSRVESLTQDNIQSRREVQSLTDDLSRLKDQLTIYSSDTIKWKAPADAAEDMFAQKGLEEKVALLVKEKKELELLMSRLQSAVPSNAMQRVFLDMMKTRSEIEVSERDRLRLENLLLTKESEMRLHTRSGDRSLASDFRKEVDTHRIQLSEIDTQIAVLKRKMNNFEGDLQEIEKVERRKANISEENERRTQEQSGDVRRTQGKGEDFEIKRPAAYEGERGAKTQRNVSPEGSKDDSFQSNQSIEFRLSRLGVRETRPRLTIQDKLSQAKAELSQLRKRPIT